MSFAIHSLKRNKIYTFPTGKNSNLVKATSTIYKTDH